MSNPIFTETNARIAALPGIQNCDYSAKEARQALAIQDAGVAGGGTVLGSSNPTQGTSDAIILAADALRTTVLIQNQSASDTVYIQFGVAAAVNDGFALAAGEDVTFGGVFATKEIHAISTGAATQLMIFTTAA